MGWYLILVSVAYAGEAIGATGAAAPVTPEANPGSYASIASAVVSTAVATLLAFERISGWKKADAPTPPPVAPPAPPVSPAVPPPSPVAPEILTRLSSLETRIGAIEKTTETIKDNDRNTGLSLARMEGTMGTFSERFERLETMLTKAIFHREH